MYGVIYETTYINTGEKYIGQTTKSGQDLDKYFGSGLRIQRIQSKHSKDVFTKTILCECNSKEELDRMEIFYINENNPELNISSGGNGGNLGEKVNKLLSDNHADFSGNNHPMYGKKHTMASKEKMKKSHANNPRSHSEEWKKEHSNRMKGESNPMYNKSSWGYMDEDKKAIRKHESSKKFSGENNYNYGKFGKDNHNSRKVKCIELNKVFCGVRDAARETGMKNHSSISQCCLGKRKTSGGYHWKYI